MAAIQTIRNHGKLIVGALGLALFGFIAGDLFQAIEGLVIGKKQQAGEVCGTSLDINEYNQLVDEMTQVRKLMLRIQGQSDNLTDAQIQQIRDEVWQDFVRTQIIAEQADEAGIQVTDKDVENALVKGEHSSLQLLVPFFGTPEGKLNFTALQEFLNTKEQTLAQAQQAQNQALVEQVDMIYTLWQFTEKQLRKELLEAKFYSLVSSACIATPFNAQLDSLDNVQKRAIVAAYPYNAIQDADITVSDADLQATYEANKELFKLYAPVRSIKLIDVEVTADSADYNTLLAEVEESAEALRAGNDPAAVVAASKSIVSYNALPVRKDAYKRMNEIYSALDTASVGYVAEPFYSPADNTMNTFKLVSKVNAPDSVLFRLVKAVATDPNASKVLADSIADAVKGGASFAELAKKYQQPSDSMWLATAHYENGPVDAYYAEMINLVNNTKPGEVAVLKADNNSSMVIEVLDAKNFIDKYNVAVVKCKNEFSKRTYNAALSKLNKFLSENTTIEAIEQNALAANYLPKDIELAGSSISEEAYLPGIKEAIRWALDDAEVGAVSRIYECGAQKEHLIVFAVTEAHNDEYRAWDSKGVKAELEAIAKKNKKAEKALELVGTPKTIDEVAKVANVVVDSTITASFANNVFLSAVGVSETALSGAIATAKAGKFVGPIKGEGAVYFVQVVEEVPSVVPYNKDNALQVAAQKYMNNIVSLQRNFNGQSQPREVLINALTQDAKVVDNRYKF